jgi:adhesin/invasin
VVTFPNGNTATTTVGPGGTWSVTPPASYNPQDRDAIKVDQTLPFNRAGGKTSQPAIVVLDRQAPPAPVLTPSAGASLTGTTTEKGGQVTVVDASGKVLGSAIADANGKFTVPLSPAAKVGDIVKVTVSDSSGNTSLAANLRIGLIAVTVDLTSLTVGQEQTIRVINLQPGESAVGTVHSDPIDLGSQTADANGAITFTWKPEVGHVGTHTVTVVAPFSGEATSLTFTVLPVPVAQATTASPTPTPAPSTSVATLANTGTQFAAQIWPWALAVVILGLVLLLVARRRRAQR